MTDEMELLRVLRGGYLDTVHRGSFVLAKADGEIVLSGGDPEKRAFLRSSAKPLQAIPLVESGAADEFGLTDRELALVCASHAGRDEHVATAGAILSKAGVPLALLKSGAGIRDNCSGKHAGMLALASFLHADIESYLLPDHPVQLRIRETVGAMAGLPADDVGTATDGCGAPIHYLPLRAMARAYARLGEPSGLDPTRKDACGRIVRAMQGHPEMTNEPDWRPCCGLKLITKGGAAGLYCGAAVAARLGFAMKAADGSSLPLIGVFLAVMEKAGVLTKEEAACAQELRPLVLRNRRGETVGRMEVSVCWTSGSARREPRHPGSPGGDAPDEIAGLRTVT